MLSSGGLLEKPFDKTMVADSVETYKLKAYHDGLWEEVTDRFEYFKKICKEEDKEYCEEYYNKALNEGYEFPDSEQASIKRLYEMGTEVNKKIEEREKEISKEEYKAAKLNKKNLREYIKKKIGNKSDFEAKIKHYHKEYKEGREVIPLKEMKEIYGAKGVLMMICRLEDGSVGKKKLSSNYRKICKKIRQNYKALKVEAVVVACKKRVENLKTEGINKAWEELESGLKEKKISLEAYGESLTAKSTSKKPLTVKAISDIKSKIAKLKNTKESEKVNLKNLVNNVVKEIRKAEGGLLLGDSDHYWGKYLKFINGSGRLAKIYLEREGEKKLKRLSKVKEGKWKNSYTIDVCKIASMCLVAVCSREDGVKKFGNNYIKKIQNYWSKFSK